MLSLVRALCTRKRARKVRVERAFATTSKPDKMYHVKDEIKQESVLVDLMTFVILGLSPPLPVRLGVPDNYACVCREDEHGTKYAVAL
jgi:hypothetical protein